MAGATAIETTFRLAWRNLWRHPQRTALMISIVAFGSFCIIVVWGVTDGWLKTMTHAQISLDQGDLKVFSAGYRQDPVPGKGLFPEALARAWAEVGKIPGANAAPRLVLFGMLRSAYGAQGVEIRGVDPIQEPQVTELDRRIVEGDWLSGPGQLLLSTTLAKELDVRLGERVVLLAQGERGPASQAFVVVGLYSSGFPRLDRATVLVPLEEARALSGYPGATELVVRLSGGRREAVARLQAALGEDYEVAGFFELNPMV
ncbi:ABC transporter permease, partial [Candidatus Bipolaricaulota bacterium]|nr:ABC transporter permease [Candidatus Bipolaricaulota bacterium]